MSAAVEIRSVKALRHWLSANSGNSSGWFVSLHPTRSKWLLISDQPWHDFQWDSYTIERRPMYPIQLPDPKEARNWWMDIWERQTATFRYSQTLRVLLLAKAGAWACVPEWLLIRPKDEFVEVSERQVRDVLGKQVVSQLVLEHNLCGLSTRTLDHDAAKRLEGRSEAKATA
jgi:hypothetical protein